MSLLRGPRHWVRWGYRLSIRPSTCSTLHRHWNTYQRHTRHKPGSSYGQPFAPQPIHYCSSTRVKIKKPMHATQYRVYSAGLCCIAYSHACRARTVHNQDVATFLIVTLVGRPSYWQFSALLQADLNIRGNWARFGSHKSTLVPANVSPVRQDCYGDWFGTWRTINGFPVPSIATWFSPINA